MPNSEPPDIERGTPPFDELTGIRRLASARSGRDSVAHVRHHLYVAYDKRRAENVLIKVTAKPGLIYQANLSNEIASLTAINRGLPTSPYFPIIKEHGRLRDSRVYLISSLFDEFPLASSIDAGRVPARMVAHLRAAMEIARALIELHSLQIVHVDLNPMNILYRVDKGRPVIRIVDFESSFERARHLTGFYDPPTTPGFSAPELSGRAPDARTDLFSLGAVLYTMLAGPGWTWVGDVDTCAKADDELDRELKDILLAAVNRNPDKRYRSVQAFNAALAAYLERIWPGRSW